MLLAIWRICYSAGIALIFLIGLFVRVCFPFGAWHQNVQSLVSIINKLVVKNLVLWNINIK